jgi:hypothetical protein
LAGAAPTATDDVDFGVYASAYNVTIGTGAVCQNIVWNGPGGANAVKFIGTGTLTIYGSMTAASTGITAATTAFAVNFAAAGSVTITPPAVVLTTGTVDFATGTFTLGAALTTGGAMTVTSGTFDTSASNYNVTAASFASSNSNTRSLNFRGSTLTFSGNSGFSVSTSTGLTFSAGTSQINLSAVAPNFLGGSQTFYNVSYTSANVTGSTITGNNTFNNFTIGAKSTTGLAPISIGGNQTINGNFTVSSGATDTTRRFFFFSSTLGTRRTISCAGTVSITNIDFRDITAAGAATRPWTGTSIGNCTGNTDITPTTPKTVYWNLAGSNNWSATGWATTNNGAPAAANFPLPQDTVIFTEAGAAGTVTINANWNIGSINMADGVSNRTTAMTLASGTTTPAIYGSLTFFSSLTLTGTGVFTFAGQGVTNTINSAGVAFTQPITLNAVTGTLQLAANITLGSGLTFIVTSGAFDANNFAVTTGLFNASGTIARTVTMGSGTWTLSGVGNVWNVNTTTNLTLSSASAPIVLSNTTTSARTFFGGGFTYKSLTIGGATGASTLTLAGANTFGELASTKTVAHTIVFPNVTTTVLKWSISGSAGNLVTLSRTGASGSFTLNYLSAGDVSADYLSISNSTASPPNTWYAGANSIDNGGNINWIFTVAPSGGDYTGSMWLRSLAERRRF